MLPEHVLFEKAVDSVYAKKPNATLGEIETDAGVMVEKFKARCRPPEAVTTKSEPDPVSSTSPPPPTVPPAPPAKPPQ